MTKFKKFWIVFLSLLPLSAGAAMPLLIGAIGGGAAIAGFSIYRSFAPVNPADAYLFFSSCWSCGLFGDIMATLSGMLPGIYRAIGLVTIPMAFALTAVFVAWTILSGFIGVKKPDADPTDANYGWSLAGKFGSHMVKLTIVVTLLAMPLPRMITGMFVEPVFNIGLGVSNAASYIGDGTNGARMESCVIATTIADADTATGNTSGAFSPKLRHSLTCTLGGIHQMTGLGITAGWTMMNMAFNHKYMHKFLWAIPIFPNVPLILAGLLILSLFFFALLPIPMYFLQTIIKLSMDLIMLPLMLLGWLFDGWKIMPAGGRNIKDMINEVIQNTVGIAMVGVFIVFAVMFLDAMLASMPGVSTLSAALAENNAEILMDGLLMQNDSVITIILTGIFIAMFMTSIPALVGALFKNVKIPDQYYKTAERDIKQIWGNSKKWWKGMNK